MEAMQVEGLPEPQLPSRWAEYADWALNYRASIIRIVVAVLFGCLLSWNIYHSSHKKHFNWCPTTVTVEKDKSSGFSGASGLTRTSDFTSISAAVDAAPQNSSQKFCIFIRKGVYHENVLVGQEKMNLVFIGEGINKTIIKPKQIAGDDDKVFNGSLLATLMVKGLGFMAKDLTLESAPGPQTAQTVALENWADQSVFYKCSFVGQNAALYTNFGRQFYRNCHIQGVHYFISGSAKAVFQECRVEAVKLNPEENTVISLSRGSPNMITGLVFQRCDFLTIGRVGASPANTYLGGQSDNFTRIIVMQSFLDASIAGWMAKNSTCKSYYGEYLNIGPGSSNNRTNLVCINQIDDYTASQFTVRAFLKGQDWLPSYVPYDLDLV